MRMRYKTLVTLLAGLGMVFLFTTPVAAGSISISSTDAPNSVIQGDSFTVDVSVSGSGVQNNQIDVTLSLPNGLSCDSTTDTVSPGGTASFSCTADSPGDYTGEISISATASDSQDGSPLSASAQEGTTVLSPASLTMTTSLSDGSLTVGDTTTYTVVINNVGSAATSYSLSLSDTSGVSTSVSSGSTSGTIDGGTTESVTYTVTADGEGAHSLDPTLTAGNGQTLTESDSITVDPASSSPLTPGGGEETLELGPQTTKVATVTTNNGQTEVSISQVSSDDPVSVSVDNVATESLAVTEVGADFGTSAESETTMSVSASTDRPDSTSAAPTDTVVSYVSVDVGGDLSDDISEGSFTVDVSGADVPAEDVVAYRYHDDSWNQVETEVVDPTTVRVTTPGYSAFAIGTSESTADTQATPTATPSTPDATPTATPSTPAPTPTETSVTPTPTDTATATATEATATASPLPSPTPTPGSSGPGFTLGVALLAVLVALVAQRRL